MYEYSNARDLRMHLLIRFLYDVAGRIQDAAAFTIKDFKALKE